MGGGVMKCFQSRDQVSVDPEKDYMRILPAPTLETSKSTKKSTSSTGTSKSRMQRAEVMADTKFSAMGTLSPFMNAVGLPKELRSNIVKKIGCGAGHFTGLTAMGEYFVCGSNKFGQLGIPVDHSESDHIINQLSYGHLPFLKKLDAQIVDLACGSYFTILLLEKKNQGKEQHVITFGEARCLGVRELLNQRGKPDLEALFTHVPQVLNLKKLGDKRVAFVYAAYNHGSIAGTDGKMLVWGEEFNGFNQKTPKLHFHFPAPLTRLAFGRCHGLALTTQGSVYSWGDGTFDEIASVQGQEPLSLMEKGVLLNSRKTLIPSQISHFQDKQVVDISAGARHSLVLTADGQLHAFGDNAQEQCAVFNTLRCPQPHKIEHYDKTGRLVSFVAVESGDAHNIALSKEGVLYSWGGEGGLQTAGTSVNSHLILHEVDCVKGRVLSQAKLAHQNTILLTGDPSSRLVDRLDEAVATLETGAN